MTSPTSLLISHDLCQPSCEETSECNSCDNFAGSGGFEQVIINSISGLLIIPYPSSAPSPPVLTSSTREQELPSMFYTCTHPCVHALYVYIVLLLHFTFHCRAQIYETKIIKYFVYIIFFTTSKFNFYTTHQVF